MNIWSRLFAALALLGFALGVGVSAGDKDKKDPEKKDEKKEEKKEEKKDKKKEREPDEEKLVYGQIVNGKIKRFASESNKDFVLEVLVIDPKKVLNFEKWKADQQRSILTANPKDRPRRTLEYQRDLAKKQANPLETHSAKDVDMRAVDAVKVRSANPPIEYDDKGNLKRWTAAELAKLKGKSRLPGYPVDYDTLRVNQYVQVYLAKVDLPKGAPKKKLPDDDMELGAKPEAVMIVITGEGPR